MTGISGDLPACPGAAAAASWLPGKVGAGNGSNNAGALPELAAAAIATSKNKHTKMNRAMN